VNRRTLLQRAGGLLAAAVAVLVGYKDGTRDPCAVIRALAEYAQTNGVKPVRASKQVSHVIAVDHDTVNLLKSEWTAMR
jgi:hypothetical protein